MDIGEIRIGEVVPAVPPSASEHKQGRDVRASVTVEHCGRLGDLVDRLGLAALALPQVVRLSSSASPSYVRKRGNAPDRQRRCRGRVDEVRRSSSGAQCPSLRPPRTTRGSACAPDVGRLSVSGDEDAGDELFSSSVPVATKRYTKPDLRVSSVRQCVGGRDAQSFFCPSRHTLANACMSDAGFQSIWSAPLDRPAPNSPGSKRINRFAPIKLIPHPPALELRRKIRSLPCGSLNLSTSFCRFEEVIAPSSRQKP